jgi:hypothetical protein
MDGAEHTSGTRAEEELGLKAPLCLAEDRLLGAPGRLVLPPGGDVRALHAPLPTPSDAQRYNHAASRVCASGVYCVPAPCRVSREGGGGGVIPPRSLRGCTLPPLSSAPPASPPPSFPSALCAAFADSCTFSRTPACSPTLSCATRSAERAQKPSKCCMVQPRSGSCFSTVLLFA